MTFPTYDDADAGVCYTCGRDWLPGEPERHRRGCPRLLAPVGAIEPGTCFECGAREILGACTNEGGCRRWRDVVGEIEYDSPEADPPAYGELVAARREGLAPAGDLDDLPF
ncbi:MAG: hypothetical protein AB7G23_21520 [Vicinamibacterales bacterium]